MERSILLVFILAVIGFGLFAGGGALVSMLHPQPDQMSYVTLDGDCKIRVYDDPLYAEHWAKEINPYNCQSYFTQEKAENVKAETRRTNVETNNMITAVYSIFGVVVLTLVAIVFAIIRG